MTIKHLNYDEPVLRYHQIVAQTTADLAPFGGRVADLGCGPGQVIASLRNLRSDLAILGVDGDTECLRLAKQRCPEAALVQDDIECPASDDVWDESFDVIMSSHSLEHIADPVGALGRWREMLADDGKLVIAVPNSLQPLLLAGALGRRPKANAGHYFIWDRATFENFCRLAGFRILQSTFDYVPLATVRLRNRLPMIAKAERALLKVAPQFSNSHIVVLQPVG
ncbi:MAG: class I SAM-dependent methyltransferase [Acidimicrobiales bacterium]